jgi:hypothetical protein
VRQSAQEHTVKNSMIRALVFVVTGALCIAAAAPVAIRVEVQPLRQSGSLTEVEVVVQIAPMDRARMGSNAIVRLELDEGRVSSGSPMRAVSIEDDGSFRIAVEWPPGEHDLRVFVEDPTKEDTGLWVGKVRIPDLSATAPAQNTVEAPSDPDPAPDPDPDPETSEMPEPTTKSDSEKKSDTPISDTTVLTDAAVVADTATSSEGPALPDSTELQVPKPETPVEIPEPEPTAVEVEEAPTAIESIPEMEAAPEPDPEPMVAPSEAETTPSVDEPVDPQMDTIEPAPEAAEEVAEAEPDALEGAEPPVAEEPPPLVEPLRADPPAESTVPEANTVETAPETVPVTADRTSRYREWMQADPGTDEFSVILLRGRQPARNVEAASLRVRIGGSETPVEQLGGAESAPLLLGLAVDVAPEEIEAWSGMQGSLAPIIDRATAGRGRLFVSNQRGVGDWEADPESLARMGGPAEAMNVANLVVASLERFEDQRGRTFLVVLTDGRSEPTKDEWQRATDVAGVSGVPILVISLWDEQFNQKTRKNLKKLTLVSGGSLFLVQGRAQLESAADRFGRYLDGGYSIRYRAPAAAGGAATPLSVSAVDKTIEVSAPKSIR